MTINRNQHRSLGIGNIHPLPDYLYATTTAMNAATGFTSDDISKVARVTADNSLWALLDTTPTWIGLSANAINLDDLANVSIDSVTDNELIVYDAGSGNWINKTLSEAGIMESLSVFRSSWPAGKFRYPVSNPAPLDNDIGTYGSILRQLFDDTTEEFVEGDFIVPSDIASGGTVTFGVYGYAVTADGNEVQFRFSHSSIADGESWDAAYTTEDSGDVTTYGTQDYIDYFTWTETVSNLGWSANDHIRFKLSRIAINDGTGVSGDYGVIFFVVSIPRI